MTHEEAQRTSAVERYVLAEMASTERDTFEEHYFGCEICAEDLRVLTIFIENARAISLETPPQDVISVPTKDTPRKSWFSLLFPVWAPGALAAALAIAVMVETATIHQLREPRIGPVAVLHGESRGEVPKVGTGQPLSLLIALDEPFRGTRIAIDIRDSTGAVVNHIIADAPAQENGISLFVPEPNLKPGRYAVVIGTKMYPFEVR